MEAVKRTGKTAFVALKADVYRYARKMLGAAVLRAKVRQLYLDFNGGNGGPGVREYVAKNLILVAATAAVEPAKHWCPELSVKTALHRPAVPHSSASGPIELLTGVPAAYGQQAGVQASGASNQSIADIWRSLGHASQTPFMQGKAKPALQFGMHGNGESRELLLLAKSALQFVKPLDVAGRGLSAKARAYVVGAAITAVRALYEAGLPARIEAVVEFLARVETMDAKLAKAQAAAHREGRPLVVSAERLNAPEHLARFFRLGATITGTQEKERAYRVSCGMLHLWLKSPDRCFVPGEAPELTMSEFCIPAAHKLLLLPSTALALPSTVPVALAQDSEDWLKTLLAKKPAPGTKSAVLTT